MALSDIAGMGVGSTSSALPNIGAVRQAAPGDPDTVAAVRHGELLGVISTLVVAGTVSILSGKRSPLVIGIVGFGAVALVYEHALRKAPLR